MGSVTSKWVVLGYIRKQVQQIRKSKLVISIGITGVHHHTKAVSMSPPLLFKMFYLCSSCFGCFLNMVVFLS